MSGFGERFRKAGYVVPKPMIEIEGKPIIAHVIDMFPGEKDFIFICNQDHLNNPDYHVEDTLKKYCPSGRIIGISPHKLGPIYAVSQVESLIDLNRPVIVNYCDFTCYWDWSYFKKFVTLTACRGSIPAYKGFHPHSLGNTNYAYIREINGLVKDIQEKQSYTKQPMTEYASSGTYYFATGRIMCEAFHMVMDNKLSVNGEYYVSMAYKHLLATEQDVTVYPLQHFIQWGTPEDVAEYNNWSNAFRLMLAYKNKKNTPIGSIILPMAGLGQRFVDENFELTKPLIPVSGVPMVAQSSIDLPISNNIVFVVREDMLGLKDIVIELNKLYPLSIIKLIDRVTEGQACTALIGLDALEKEFNIIENPLTIGACDNGAIYDQMAFLELVNNEIIDVIVWGVRGFTSALRNPKMYGWINEKNGIISSISVKKPTSNPSSDPIVIGTFTFRRASDFRRVIERLIARDGRVNGEFYIDSCINDAIELGLHCQFFEVSSYLCWGTPNDLRTFEYWQSCLHKWPGHPYRLEMDSRVPLDKINELENKYKTVNPSIPVGYK